MAKGNAKAKRPAKAQEDTEAKPGKKKWIFLILLLLILIVLGAGYFFGLGPSLTSFFNESEESVKSFEQTGEVAPEPEPMIEEDISKVLQVEKTESEEEEKEKRKTKPVIKKYYVKVEDCTVVTCQNEVVQFLKQENLPHIKKTYTRPTVYYELISSTVYSLQTAKAKIDLLKRQEIEYGQPFLVRENKRYRISMGLFPEEETGRKLMSSLTVLYPKIEINFELKARDRRYQVTSIYAGPFRKNRAEQVLQRMKRFPEYETSELTRL